MAVARGEPTAQLQSRVSRRPAHPALWALAAAFAGTLFIGLLQGSRPFYADSEGYWVLGNAFSYTGHFSLLNYYAPSRGYTLPLVTYVLKRLASGSFASQSLLVTLFNVVIFSFIGAILAPALARATWPGKHWGAWRRVALSALLLVFWAGDLSYPLTDFPGLAMGLLALVAVSRCDSPAWMLVAGAAAGASLNLRPAYLPLAPILLVLVGLAWRDQRHSRHASRARRAACVSLLAIGFIGISLPQSLAMHRFYGDWNFIPGWSAQAQRELLTAGMKAQRWDSYEGYSPPNAIDYEDASGTRMLEGQPGKTIKDDGQYLGLVVRHPGVMVPLLARHVVNGLDARYNTVYVEHLDGGGRLWLRVSGFLLVLLALVRLLWPAARRSLGPARWRYPIAFASCVLTAIPSPVETRYMLALYVLSYMLVLAPGWPNPIATAHTGWRRYRATAIIASCSLAFAVVIWQTLASVPFRVTH
jgi:hypothetical protein